MDAYMFDSKDYLDIINIDEKTPLYTDNLYFRYKDVLPLIKLAIAIKWIASDWSD